MRRIFTAAVALAVAGCAANSQIPADRNPTGTYELIAVDGQAVPHKISTGEEILSGKLTLKKDGNFEVLTNVRAQMTSTEPFTFERQFTGTYTTSEIGVQLVWRGGVETSGAFFGRTLRVFHNGVEYLYMK